MFMMSLISRYFKTRSLTFLRGFVIEIEIRPRADSDFYHRGWAETGGGVDFNQPGLQIAVNDDVVPVALNSEHFKVKILEI